MKIVYIAESSPAKKTSKKDDLKQAAELLAVHLGGSVSSRRRAERIYQMVLDEKAVA